MNQMLKFVIVGHVDHGKSTLIGRLLFDTHSLPKEKVEEIKEICEALGKPFEFGYVMDHLEEEREQGITIDTAQIFFNTDMRTYVIIDAPGHVEFLRNMITGASQAEAGVLIVDVSEGVREQTKRHAFILRMLGIERVLVVINKMDTVGYAQERFEAVKEELMGFLSKIGVVPAHVIPISAREGDNIARSSEHMPWYKGPTVLDALDALPARRSAREGPMRFVVQDVYERDERIVVGRVESGVLRVGDEVVVLPSRRRARVVRLREFMREPEEAEAGKSIGVVLDSDVPIDRGDVIAWGDAPAITDTIRASIFWMHELPLTEGTRLAFRCATQDVMCTVERIERVMDSSSLELVPRSEVREHEVATVVLRTERPVVVESFNRVEPLGRFVLADDDTRAGGIITELQA